MPRILSRLAAIACCPFVAASWLSRGGSGFSTLLLVASFYFSGADSRLWMSWTIRQSDARELDIDDDSVDLICTSPPYNVGIDYEDDETDDSLSMSEYRSLLRDVFDECRRVLESDGRMAVNVSPVVGRPMIDLPRTVKDIAEDAGLHLRDEIVWVKGDSESSSAWGSWRSASNPRQIMQHESVLVFYLDSAGREETRSETLPKDEFLDFSKSVWTIKPDTNHVDHPAAFPAELPYRILRLHSYRGDRVLDPFAGSGTTVAVADALGRDAVGVDVSEEYVERARERVRSFRLEEVVDRASSESQATLREAVGRVTSS